MPFATHIPTELIKEELQLLCAQPSSAQQRQHMVDTARLVADMVRRTGIHARLVHTSGAPIVIGQRSGASNTTILLYHHYDVAPTGPWYDWSHEPFTLAERDDIISARGVSHGKGPLVAHLQALKAILTTYGELPCNITLLIEGERLRGSPHLASTIRKHARELQSHGCLTSGGERDSHGRPFCYSGSKGLLQVRLTTTGATVPLESGFATSVRHPLWRLIWALGSIKGEDEDIRFNGFYDDVDGPSRDMRAMLRHIQIDEESRLQNWNISEFLFGMHGSGLLRTEITLPTCHVSSLTCEPPDLIGAIPTQASALLEFQLVPKQRPTTIFNLLLDHLESRGLTDVTVEKLPGSYPPVSLSTEQHFVQRVAQAGESIYAAPLTTLPLGTFTQPLHVFTHYLKTPVAVLGFARHGNRVYGINESVPLDDLVQHGQLLIELLFGYCEHQDDSP